MLQTLFSTSPPIVGQIWSLSVEWWHYMIAPRLTSLSWKILVPWIIVSLYTFAGGPVPAGWEWLINGRDEKGLLSLSWLWVSGFVYFKHRGTLLGFLILTVPAVYMLCTGHFMGKSLFITIVVLLLAEVIPLSAALVPRLNFLGDLSFPLYLFHIPTMAFLLSFHPTSKWLMPWLMVGSSLLVSLAALYWVDYPCRRLFADRPQLLHTGKVAE